MKNSADFDGSLRERKRAATHSAITSAARGLTAEHGLAGFTVEELCEQVGISRRTFFNYFPAKEDAVLGAPAALPEELTDPFIAAGTPGPGLSPTLLQDLVDLSVAHMESMAVSRAELTQLKDALSTEPKLVLKLMQGTREADERLRRLIARREHLEPADPRITAVTTVFSALIQRAGPEFFDPDNKRSYRAVLTSAVESARAAFSSFSPVTASKDPS
ncbi:TetR/AcrR family transcriptional regulator [Arthrobacter sp. 3Tela_A]|uniref:TetR/AcrR family transcriptional regulator n=1 Tax=Arthrobacter sp. 3Tela_A TaxID=3093743 RepID=UPI003BB58912